MHSDPDDNPPPRPFSTVHGRNSMPHEPAPLVQYEGFGSVTLCTHHCIHVQLGFTTMTLTEAQYFRLVAMLSESAANFEFFRHRQAGGERDESE